MRLIQITDCHLYADPQARSRGGFPLRQLHAVLDEVRRQRPDALLVTGDISEDESAASYAHALEAFDTLDCPWFWLPGNHDHLQHMREARELVDEVALGHWRLLLLDSQVVGESYGELGEAQCRQLDERLTGDTRPTLIAMHHPPVDVGAAWMDAIGLRDREAFWSALLPYEQVRGVVCGHIHQAFAGRYPRGKNTSGPAGIPVYGTPATTDQFLAGAKRFTLDQASRPGYRVIKLGQQGLESWVERVTL